MPRQTRAPLNTFPIGCSLILPLANGFSKLPSACALVNSSPLLFADRGNPIEFLQSHISSVKEHVMSYSKRSSSLNTFQPALEQLESRFTPAAQLIATYAYSGGGDFLNGLYHNVLNRVPDAGGRATWTLAMTQGVSHATIANQIWQSSEHRGLEVDQFYQALLNRAADGPGRQSWSNSLLAGASEVSVMQQITLSGEFSQFSSDPAVFVTTLYTRVLGRSPDSSSQASWVAALQAGESRADVSMQFLLSNEAKVGVIDSYYANLLGRTPNSLEEQSWLIALNQQGNSYQTVANSFLSSTEYGQKYSALV
jgi:hypothetical protein